MADFPMPSEPPEPTPASPHVVWAKTALWVLVVLIVALNGLFVFKTCVAIPGRVADKTSNLFTNLIAAANHARVTTEFISYATSVHGNQRLQVATLRQMELFTETYEKTSFWVTREAVVEARAPVEYTYYLELNAPWKLVVREHVVEVFAPEIKFNQPAINVGALKLEVRKGGLTRPEEEAKQHLLKTLTVRTVDRARDNIPLLRETARRQVEEFVAKWLARAYTDGKDFPVKVYFSGESTSPEVQSPEAPK